MILIFLFSGCAAVFSFFAEMGFGMTPCFLCLVQKALHLSLFVFSALFLISGKRLFTFLSLILLAASVLVASYHTLIQFGLVQDQCQAAVRITDLASYKAALSAPSPCKESWKLGSIPVSAFNAAVSGGLFFLTLFKRKT